MRRGVHRVQTLNGKREASDDFTRAIDFVGGVQWRTEVVVEKISMRVNVAVGKIFDVGSHQPPAHVVVQAASDQRTRFARIDGEEDGERNATTYSLFLEKSWKAFSKYNGLVTYTETDGETKLASVSTCDKYSLKSN